MKRSSSRQSLMILTLLSTSGIAPLFGQGPLAPPGSPAPAMKRLDEVEARTIVNIANCPATGTYAYSISAAAYPNGGSFYLTGNLDTTGAGGILISASNVTLDLNGFSVVANGSPTALSGILISGSNVTVHNGGIRGGGYSRALSATGSGVTNIAAKNLTVSGTSTGGIAIANGIAQSCVVNAVNGIGLLAPVVSDSSATQCSGTAISATTVSNVTGTTTGSGPAIIPTPDSQTIGNLDTRVHIPGGTAPYVINTPGSYLLTGNLTVATGNAITIESSGVTLDLGGFQISSTNAAHSGTGVNVSALSGHLVNVVIENGSIISSSVIDQDTNTTTAGPGFSDGIDFSGFVGTKLSQMVVRNVDVSGCFFDGIDGNNAGVRVEGCTASGIQSGISLADIVTNRVGIGGHVGISSNSQIQNSQGYAVSSGGYGIDGNLVNGCFGSGATPIRATSKFNSP